MKILALTFLSFLILIVPQTAFAQKKKPQPGELIYKAEKLLSEKGYWITKVDRKKDSSTYHATVAFQKVEKLRRTGILTNGLLTAISKASRPKPAYTGIAHVEVDLTRQVLFLVDDKDIVTHILPISSGNGKVYYQDGKRQIAHTPRGIFKVTRQIKGIRRAPLGTLYHPSYFYGGVAIHGSGSIPFYPASHGCIRIPRFASKKFNDLINVGTYVVVFDKSGPKESLVGKEVTRRSEDIQTIPCDKDLLKNPAGCISCQQ